MFGLSRLAIQIILSSGVLAVLVTSCVVRDKQIEKRGASKIVDAGKKFGTNANATNSNVRARTREPGSFERLLKDSCRDCGP